MSNPANPLGIILSLSAWIISSAVLVILAFLGAVWLFTEWYKCNIHPLIFVILFFLINLGSVLWLVIANRKYKNQE